MNWQLLRQHKLLIFGFLLAVFITLMLLMRTLAGLALWSDDGGLDISGWMTPRYVAVALDVDIDVILMAVNLEKTPKLRVTFAKLAEQQGVTLEQLESQISESISAQQANP